MVQVLCESDAREWAGRIRSTMTRKRRRHTPDRIIRKLAEGHKAARRRAVAGGDVSSSGDRRVDMASVARPVRRDEGQRRQAPSRARGENVRLKKLLAEAELGVDLRDMHGCQPVASANSTVVEPRHRGADPNGIAPAAWDPGTVSWRARADAKVDVGDRQSTGGGAAVERQFDGLRPRSWDFRFWAVVST